MLEALLLAAGLYWGLTAIFTFFQTKLERRLSKGYDRNVQLRCHASRDGSRLEAAMAGEQLRSRSLRAVVQRSGPRGTDGH